MHAWVEFATPLSDAEASSAFAAFTNELVAWVRDAYPFADRQRMYGAAVDRVERMLVPGTVALSVPLDEPFSGAYAAHLLRVAARHVRRDDFRPSWQRSYRLDAGAAWVAIDFCVALALREPGQPAQLLFPKDTKEEDRVRLSWDALSGTEQGRITRMIEVPYCGCPVCSMLPPVAGDEPLRTRLESHPRLVDIQLGGKATMLHGVALSGRANEVDEQLRLLLGHGADLEARDELDQTPLLAAIARGVGLSRYESIKKLIAAGARTDVRGRLGSARELVERRLVENRELLTPGQVAECEEVLAMIERGTHREQQGSSTQGHK